MKSPYSKAAAAFCSMIVIGVAIETRQPGMTLVFFGGLGLLALAIYASENSGKGDE